MATTARFDRALAALAHPARRRIVERLTRGPACVTDLAAPFDMSLNGVSKHLKVLEGAGLISRTRSGREHVLSLKPEPLRQLHAWSGKFHRFWSDRLDALEDHLKASKEDNS
ncbi:MAG: metalloregulator ArsR/SmtB family transcription factor [Candidatus Eisenbacteria bacterium]|nr:metalloregulator ArsR/SmtB family transcription factor [Candidatus Eisenbacteria bacterium]